MPAKNYASTFFSDVLNLLRQDHVSPEVIFRELRVLEGIDKPLMMVDGDEPIPIYLATHNNQGRPKAFLNRSPSATKDGKSGTPFNRPKSPLNGLWHKHYYVHQSDFLQKNVNAQNRRHRDGFSLPPITAMMSRLAEGKLTGEWIVFKKDGQTNTYLCLAKHEDKDELIYERIKNFI